MQPDPTDIIRAGGLAVEAARALAPGDWPGSLKAAGPIVEWLRDWTDEADLEARQSAIRAVLMFTPLPKDPSLFVTAAEAARVAIVAVRDRPGTAGITLPPRFAAAVRNLILAAVFQDSADPAEGRSRLITGAAKYGGVTDPEMTPGEYDEILAALFAGDHRAPLLMAGDTPPGYGRVTPEWVRLDSDTTLDPDGRYDIGAAGNPPGKVAEIALGLSAGEAGRVAAEAARLGRGSYNPVYIRAAAARQDVPDGPAAQPGHRDPPPRHAFGPDPGMTGGTP